MLAHAGCYDRFAARVTIELLDHVAGLDQGTRAVVVHRVDALELGELGEPGAEVAPEPVLQPVRGQRPERLPHQPDVAPVYPLDLVHLGAIDVQMSAAP